MCIWLLCVGVRDDLDDATALAVGVLLGECLVTLVGGVGEFNARWVILCWPGIALRRFVALCGGDLRLSSWLVLFVMMVLLVVEVVVSDGSNGVSFG